MQFAPANATPKIAKEYVSPTLTSEITENFGKPSRTWKASLQQCIKIIAVLSLKRKYVNINKVCV
ncbi:hypothetical protein DDV96_02685 [Marixanthomonas spongiae]|uniref:Uncharacterized protein n=1 Tax=Marixanthomonas spongiae TaxID=2174845 RepID=A0A2U0I517_9FLAO|nr:hypothetical protein DDV96_02685 [Marixanthomonas spongiae]